MELKGVLQKCMQATTVVMNAEAGSLMLKDNNENRLNVSIPTGPVGEQIKGYSIPSDKGIAGHVLQTNIPYLSNNVSESPYFWKDLSKEFTTRNIICVPLKRRDGSAMGVVEAINRKDGKSFVNGDVEVFESLASHMSMAIERAEKYEEMVRKVEDRETQLSEIHHRLKNNLSTICAMIEMDTEDLIDEQSIRALRAAGSRLRSVSEVHSLLYNVSDPGEVELSEYIGRVANNVLRVFGSAEKDIQLHSDLNKVYLRTNKAMTVGLIVNELLINAIQHAFSDRESGDIHLCLKQPESQQVLIRVSDNGKGIEGPAAETREISSRGTFIIQALTKKLKGALTSESNPGEGASFELIFLK